jgi:CheY-like chemotaxis protein
MNARTILLVEDNRVVLRALEFKLRLAGYEVVCSEDPSAAVAAARIVNPDLYILDINFPPEPGSRWTGFTMAEWLHHMHVGDERPIIFITADAIQKHLDQAARVGAVAVLPKPLDIAQLLATVAHYLGPVDAAA